MVSQDRVNVSVALVASGGSKENIFSQFLSVHGGGLYSLARGHLDSLSKYTPWSGFPSSQPSSWTLASPAPL